jgi:hypothetical protein
MCCNNGCVVVRTQAQTTKVYHCMYQTYITCMLLIPLRLLRLSHFVPVTVLDEDTPPYSLPKPVGITKCRILNFELINRLIFEMIIEK